MVNSRNEEPDFDTDEEGNSDDESSFDDGSTEEEGDEGSSEEEGDVGAGDESEYDSEEESDEDGGDDDEEDEERNMGSEEESGLEDEDDDEEDDDDSEEDDGSEDMSEDFSDEDGDDIGDVESKDEENGMNKIGLSSGSLMNEETGQNDSWKKYVPGCIVAMGVGGAALLCCCICLIPLLAIAIGLGVGLSASEVNDATNGNKATNATVDINDVVSSSFTSQPTKSPTTFAPTEQPLIPITTLTSDADTTIYRDGEFRGSSYGTGTTMLVQNGPAGDSEIASAYSLIQFDGIQGIDSDTMSIDAYLSNIDGLTIQFCLNRVGAEVDVNDENGVDGVVDNTGPVTEYSTCLLPSTDVTETDIETLTGDNAPDYTIPDSCVNGEVTVFEFIAGTTQICIDVTSLFGGNSSTPDEDVTPPALRGRRFLQEDDVTNATTATGTTGDTTLLFMIDTLDTSDKPGDRFYTKADPNGRVPTLKFGGENTCRTVADIACNDPKFSTLCSLVVKADLVDKLDSNDLSSQKTVFAPTNDAFSRLSEVTLEALNDTDALVDVLLYHIAPVKIMSDDLECGLSTEMASTEMASFASTTTLCGKNGTFYQAGGGVTAGLPQIIAADIETCYGVIHVIDEVLLPGDPDGGNATCVSNETKSLADIACTLPKLSILCGLVKQAGIADLFAGGLFTIFAPTDDAFQLAFESFGQIEDLQVITNVLLQHVVWGSAVDSEDLVCDMTVPMANGDDNIITCKEDVFFVGGPGNDVDAFPGIVTADIDACNGVIHIIDGVLLPGFDVTSDEDIVMGSETPCGICGDGFSITATNATIKIPDSIGLLAQQGDVTCAMAEGFCMFGYCTPETCAEFADGISNACGCAPPGDIPTTAAAAGNFNTLVEALGAADLVGALSKPKGPFTVFAPTDDAFNELPDGLVECLLKENKDALSSILLYHVVDGEVLLTDLTDGLEAPTLLDGEDVTVDLTDGVKINNSTVIKADVPTSNGVIHVIDTVLVPPSINAAAILETCGGGAVGGGDADPAMMQQCNFCGGSLQVTNADAMIPIPEEANFSGLENTDDTKATCEFVQGQCKTGFCSTEICAELTTEDIQQTCGCDELEI